tara:strand:- start:1410 stop:1745 length:336 start_codon:yes stop_codon:yes gene_type:complete
MLYTKEDIPKLEKKVEEAQYFANQTNRECYHKDVYSNPASRNVFKLRKLINLIKVVDNLDTIEDYSAGLVILSNKYIVSLANDKWRVIHRNKWYRHKQDLKHFIDTYVRKT